MSVPCVPTPGQDTPLKGCPCPGPRDSRIHSKLEQIEVYGNGQMRAAQLTNVCQCANVSMRPYEVTMEKDKRVTARMSEKDYRWFRMTAALLERSMQDCMEEALNEWMVKHGGKLEDVIRQAEAVTNTQLEDTCEQGR